MKIKLILDLDKDLVVPREEYSALLNIKNALKSEIEYVTKNREQNTDSWNFMIEDAKKRQIEAINKYKQYEN